MSVNDSYGFSSFCLKNNAPLIPALIKVITSNYFNFAISATCKSGIVSKFIHESIVGLMHFKVSVCANSIEISDVSNNPAVGSPAEAVRGFTNRYGRHWVIFYNV